MPAYVVEIETPAGRLIRKGIIAENEGVAEQSILYLQSSFDARGFRKCQVGSIVRVWEREPGKPLPKSVLSSPDAVHLLSQFRLR